MMSLWLTTMPVLLERLMNSNAFSKPLPLLITKKEIAMIVGVTVLTVDKWRKDERMNFPEAIRFGSKIRFSRPEIESWLASRPRIKGTQKNYRNSYAWAFSEEGKASAINVSQTRGSI